MEIKDKLIQEYNFKEIDIDYLISEIKLENLNVVYLELWNLIHNHNLNEKQKSNLKKDLMILIKESNPNLYEGMEVITRMEATENE